MGEILPSIYKDTMKVIKPVTFTSSMLVSSTATESTANYNSATPYAKDAEVNYSNSIYVSLQASNLNKTPGATGSEAWWIRKSANNIYAMFDEFVNTQTTGTSPLTVVFRPQMLINSLALINISNATEGYIKIQDGVGGPIIYEKTINLDSTPILDWYMYFFEPFNLSTQIILTDIPPYSDPVITVELRSGSSVSLGNCVAGSVYDLGLTQYGATAGIRDYSTKETNSFGITTFVKRSFSKRMDANLFVPKEKLRITQRVLEELRATPSVWIGSEDADYEMLTVYGYYRDFNTEINYPTYSLCSLEIEGLI